MSMETVNVPVEPTEEMLLAAKECCPTRKDAPDFRAIGRSVYACMLAAAPNRKGLIMDIKAEVTQELRQMFAQNKREYAEQLDRELGEYHEAELRRILDAESKSIGTEHEMVKFLDMLANVALSKGQAKGDLWFQIATRIMDCSADVHHITSECDEDEPDQEPEWEEEKRLDDKHRAEDMNRQLNKITRTSY
jgi:hypothetical protein